MAAPAAAPRKPSQARGEAAVKQERQVAKRIEELERKLGEAHKKLSNAEAHDKGRAQLPPTLEKNEDAGSGTLSKSGADRIKDPEFRDEMCEPAEGRGEPPLSTGVSVVMAERQESSMMDFDDRVIWETLLKQAEANLKQADANLNQAEANRAISNAILSRTQRMVGQEGTAAMEPDRLESRYVAVCDAANVATIAGKNQQPVL